MLAAIDLLAKTGLLKTILLLGVIILRWIPAWVLVLALSIIALSIGVHVEIIRSICASSGALAKEWRICNNDEL